jgi:hypothetical protein
MEESIVFLILRSVNKALIFDTFKQRRADVTAYYKDAGLNFNSSGFFAKIATENMQVGTYKLGIYIKKGDVEVLQVPIK